MEKTIRTEELLRCNTLLGAMRADGITPEELLLVVRCKRVIRKQAEELLGALKEAALTLRVDENKEKWQQECYALEQQFLQESVKVNFEALSELIICNIAKNECINDIELLIEILTEGTAL